MPRIAPVLSYHGQLALLKERSNYLCLERMATETFNELSQMRAWASNIKDGNVVNCSGIAEDISI